MIAFICLNNLNHFGHVFSSNFVTMVTFYSTEGKCSFFSCQQTPDGDYEEASQTDDKPEKDCKV